MGVMLPKSAQNVQDTLTKSGLEFKVIELSESTRTANEAAETIGCTVGQIVKSLMFQKQESKAPILVLASGVNRVNEKTIGNLLGEKVEKADADFTRKITGFAIGGIPPVGHKHPIETFIDEDLLGYKELWAAAGTPNAVFQLEPKALVTLTQGKVISIK
ncbi:MAG: YbaK/EbsC family protein [Proteobacteria bacterium]|nr:YbaK/EbsC family protein [Pseudomonadota bacterium]